MLLADCTGTNPEASRRADLAGRDWTRDSGCEDGGGRRPVASAAIARCGADPSDFSEGSDESDAACTCAREEEWEDITACTGAGSGAAGDEADGTGLGRAGGGSGERTAPALGWGAEVEADRGAGGMVAWGAAGTIGAIAPGLHPPGRLGKSPAREAGDAEEPVLGGCGAGE